MAKKKTLIKRILFIVIPIVLVLGAIGGFLMWYFAPANRINRALEAEDYQTVTALYDELYDRLKDEQTEAIQERLYSVAKDYHDDYLKEKVEYDDVADYYKLVMESVLSYHRKTKKLFEEVETIHQSRIDYDKGIELMEAGDYLGAIEFFRKVSEIDELYIDKALQYEDSCKQSYIAELIAEADVLIAEEKYESARELIISAFDYFPEEDELTAKLEEITALMYSDIEGKWSTTYDFGDLIASEMGLSGYSLYFPAELMFEFDGTTMKMYVNEDSIEEALDAMCADPDSMDALYVVAEQYGVNKLEADVLVKLFYGGSYSAFLLDQYGTEINEALNAFKCEIAYSADSRKIHLGASQSNTANYFTYESEESNSLELLSYTGNTDPIYALKFPINLIRKLF